MSNVAVDKVDSQPPAAELSPLELKVFVGHIQGWPVWRIALNTGLAEATVRSMLNKPRLQAAMAAATAQVIAHGSRIATRIAEYALPAVERLGYLMSSAKSEQVQFQASRDILDRAGYRPTERVEHTTGPATSASFNISALSPEEREQARELVLKAARASIMGAADSAGLDSPIEVTQFTSVAAEQPQASQAQPSQQTPPEKEFIEL